MSRTNKRKTNKLAVNNVSPSVALSMHSGKGKEISELILKQAANNGLAVNARSFSNTEFFDQFHGNPGKDPKHHCLYFEFGYKSSLCFADYMMLYSRQGMAGGTIDTYAKKTFESNPWLIEGDEEGKNKDATPAEKEFKKFAKRTSLWRIYHDVTIRRSVGNYAGIILKIADNKQFNEPAENVSPDDILELIPAWENQLKVTDYNQDEKSQEYGEPTWFEYKTCDLGANDTNRTSPRRTVIVHPSRVIWFGDLYGNGTAVNLGNAMLKKPYNDYVTVEKIIGSGGEGAYKNAARHLATLFDPLTNMEDLAKSVGATVEEFSDVMNQMTRELNSNFDAGMMSTAKDVKVLSTSLPDVRDPFDNAVSSIAVAFGMPTTFITGTQTGERASSENGKDVAKTITSYREIVCDYEILKITSGLAAIGCWTGVDWSVAWDSLLDASESERIDNAYKMAQTNQMGAVTGVTYYTIEEVRVTRGYEPEIELSPEQKMLQSKGEQITDKDLPKE